MSDPLQLTMKQLFDKMLAEMGPQGWWPADSKWEIILGAILVQNTNWNNVVRSLHNLRELTQFSPQHIADLPRSALQDAITPSGFYKNKSRAIAEMYAWLKQYDFDLEKINHSYDDQLRAQLLQMFGIGDETADVLLLYVFDRVEFIADKYAQKLFHQLGIQQCSDYKKLKAAVDLKTDFTLEQAQEFHGLIDEFGKLYLGKTEKWAASFLNSNTLILS